MKRGDQRTQMLSRTTILVGLCSLNLSALAQEVYFSRAGGTFVDPFVLSLTASSPNAVIHYIVITNAAQASATVTNVPTTNSPIYAASIPVSITTQIRARAFGANGAAGAPVSATFIQISAGLAAFSSDLPLVVVHNFGQGPLAGSQPSDQQLSQHSMWIVVGVPDQRGGPGRSCWNCRGDSDEEVGQPSRACWSSSGMSIIKNRAPVPGHARRLRLAALGHQRLRPGSDAQCHFSLVRPTDRPFLVAHPLRGSLPQDDLWTGHDE
jgi:hypothetical protein